MKKRSLLYFESAGAEIETENEHLDLENVLAADSVR